MELETIILSKLMQEHKFQILDVFTCKWELNDENTWTHDRRENNTHTRAFQRVENGRKKKIRKNN